MAPRDPLAYRILRALARLLVTLFYRRVEIVGREHVPPHGPLVITANHHNALIDPMLVMVSVSRPLVILAAAPLFHNPIVGPLLRLVGALPVLRRQEGIAERSRNDAMFDTVAAALGRGGAVLLFPEGRTQPEPVLLPLRTGAARMLLGAAGRGMPVALLPMGLVFNEPATFRTGRALVVIGPPVPIADLVELYRTDEPRAVRDLTERLAAALRACIVEADDRETLKLMRVVEAIWPRDGAPGPGRESERLAALQEVSRAYGVLRRDAPERVAAFRQRVEAYTDDLEVAGLADGELSASYPPRVVFGWAVREGLPLAVGLPLALLGILIHGIPYQLTRLAVRALSPGDEEQATYKILAGAVLYPASWVAEAIAAWKIGGGWALGALLAALLPAGFFALAWQERLARARRDVRAFARFLLDRDLRRRLMARRVDLRAELTALADIARGAGAPAEPRGAGD